MLLVSLDSIDDESAIDESTYVIFFCFFRWGDLASAFAKLEETITADWSMSADSRAVFGGCLMIQEQQRLLI